MNRISRESSIGGRVATGSKQQVFGGRGVIVGDRSREEDENLSLFSRIRQHQNITSPNESKCHNVSITSERRKIGSPILVRSRVDDLFSDSGKHDYDWLLTPPGTPLISPSKSSDYVPPRVASRSNSNVRSATISKTSRFSLSQSENCNTTRPARSSSTTRSSISTTSSSSFHNNRTSALNTSTSSVSSRPSTPGSRTTTLSASRTTPIPSSRPPPLRSSTPTRRQQPPSAFGDKPRMPQNSRPATPTTRPRTPSNNINPRASAPAVRSNSRPSTPSRRTPALATASAVSHSSSANRFPVSNNQNTGPASRPSSPASRVQSSKKPIALPDFPLEAPPNLRTKLPERALSAGRHRPGLPLTVRSNSNSETTLSSSSNCRQSASPIITRGRLQENSSSMRPNSSGQEGRPNNRKTAPTETAARRTIKPSAPAECTGFGRTISKYSMDTALKHMDIRKSVGNIRGATLIPQSIRSAAQRGQHGRSTDSAVLTFSKGASHLYDSGMSDTVISDNDSSSSGRFSENIALMPPQETILSSTAELNINGSSFYDEIMLKEDPKNMNWLHSVEDSLI